MYSQKSFTIVQMLIVLSLIIVLSSFVAVNLFKVEEKANIAKAHMETTSIKKAMQLYRLDYKKLPPLRDNCSACTNPCNSSWTVVVDVLVAGGYLNKRIDKDPWDNYYCYDNNDKLCCGGCSPIYSMGPNGVNDTVFYCDKIHGCPREICRDDIGEILLLGDRPYPW